MADKKKGGPQKNRADHPDKPAAKPQGKHTVKTQAKPAPKPQAKPAPKPQAKPAPKPQDKHTAKLQGKPAPKPQRAKGAGQGTCLRFFPSDLLRRVGIVLLSVLCVCGLAVSAVSVRGELLQKKVTLVYSGVLQDEFLLTIDSSQDEVRELVKATERHGQKNAFTYFCNSSLHFGPHQSYDNIVFGNPADNDCVLVLSIEDEDGSLLYRSGGVEPGKYISQLRLLSSLKPGEHACRAYVSGYADDYRCVGVQYSRIDVEMGGAL